MTGGGSGRLVCLRRQFLAFSYGGRCGILVDQLPSVWWWYRSASSLQRNVLRICPGWWEFLRWYDSDEIVDDQGVANA